MARYKLVVWNTYGAGICLRTGLFHAVITSPILRLYLAAGGHLWLDGKQTLVPTLQGTDCPDASSPLYDGLTPPEPAGDANYPHSYAPGDFAWDVLKIRSVLVDNDKGQSWFNDMVRVEALDRENPTLEDMAPDPDKVTAVIWSLRGIPHVDAIFDPILVNGVPGFRGQLDSLYTYVSAGKERDPENPKTISKYQDRVCALRWHDPDPDRLQGRVMWFGFPLYYMFDDQAQDTFNRAIDWFREEEPIPPPP
jgi:hypothetical protein